MSDMAGRVKSSRLDRAAMLRKFGFVPLSILKLHRGTLSQKMFIYQHEVPSRSGSASARMSGKGKADRQKLGVVGGGMGGSTQNAIAATTMPPELVEFFVKYYAKPGDNYLDPFMGQGIQMQVAKAFGLNYYGYDASEEFCKYVESVKAKIDDGSLVIETNLGDSRNPANIPDGIGDFLFTSPPYWDIEYYGDEKEQLGYNSTYPEFLQGMEEIARAWLPKFRTGATIVINVNDFRRKGVFYPYHADTIALFQRAGWVMHDVWIIESLIAGLPKIFALEFNQRKIAPKNHEYALVFKKPE